jgi:hypothetical protein
MPLTSPARPPLWPPQPGDVFFVQGDDIMSVLIRFFQGGGSWSHTGIFLDMHNVFETTPEETQARSFARNYAGSEILILRWIGMTPENHYRGMAAVMDQMGLDYPEGELLAFALGVQGHAKTDSGALVCSQLAATHLAGAGFPLGRKPAWYAPRPLAKEMVAHVPSGGVQIVFQGSMRLVGLVRGSGPDNELII